MVVGFLCPHCRQNNILCTIACAGTAAVRANALVAAWSALLLWKVNATLLNPRIFWLRLLAAPLALALVAANVRYDYTSAPYGLLWSPVVAVIACGLILVGASPWNAYLKAGLCAGLLMLQDAGMKLYGGGDHDAEGQGLSNFLLVLGALLSLAMLAAALRRDQNIRPVPKAGAIGLFLALLLGYLLLFGTLGEGHYVGSYVE